MRRNGKQIRRLQDKPVQVRENDQHENDLQDADHAEIEPAFGLQSATVPVTAQRSAEMLGAHQAGGRPQVLRQMQASQGNTYVRRVISEYQQIQRTGPMSAEQSRDQLVSGFQSSISKGNAKGASAKDKEAGQAASNALQGVEAFEGNKLEDDAFYEQMACVYAYLPLQEGQILPGQANGGPTKYRVVATLDDPETGLQAFSAVPLTSKNKPWGGPRKSPIVVFRGSEKYNLKEGMNDFGEADFMSLYIGASQFAPNRAQIERLFKLAGASGSQAVVMGHSLGGALAQKATVEFFEYTQRVVTFQAPGITAADFKRFDEKNKKARQNGKQGVDATSYVHEKDIVSMAGEQHLAANDTRIIQDDAAKDPIAAHTSSYLWKAKNAKYKDKSAGSKFNDRIENSFVGILAEPLRRFLGGLVSVGAGAVETGMNVIIAGANGMAEMGAAEMGVKLEESDKFKYFNPMVVRHLFSLVGSTTSFVGSLVKGLATLDFDSIGEAATELGNSYNDIGVGMFGGAKMPQTLLVEMCKRLAKLVGKRTSAYLKEKATEAITWIKNTVTATIDAVYNKLMAFKNWLVAKLIEFKNKAVDLGHQAWHAASSFVSSVSNAVVSGLTSIKSWWSGD